VIKKKNGPVWSTKWGEELKKKIDAQEREGGKITAPIKNLKKEPGGRGVAGKVLKEVTPNDHNIKKSAS